MIARVVIGDASGDEVSVSGDDHPANLRAFLREFHRGARESTVATWSPIVLDQIVDLWREAGSSGDEYSRIVLRGSTLDTSLSLVRDKDWLSHFSLGDLLARGEFDEWLRIPVRSVESSPRHGVVFGGGMTAVRCRCGWHPTDDGVDAETALAWHIAYALEADSSRTDRGEEKP